MKCPTCHNEMSENTTCSECGWDWSGCKWTLLGRFSLPQNLIIESLLKSCGVPYRTLNKKTDPFPFTIGPLAETLVFVPTACFAEAQEVVEGYQPGQQLDPSTHTRGEY